jgi:three-Cys-motif partner protein
MGGHTFGGEWTEDKLDCLGKYLSAYRKIFVQNKYAKKYRTWYVDAFAGTGSRATRDIPDRAKSLFESSYEDPELRSYRDGSAIIALGLESPFDNYFFIEKSKMRLKELEVKIGKRHASKTHP